MKLTKNQRHVLRRMFWGAEIRYYRLDRKRKHGEFWLDGKRMPHRTIAFLVRRELIKWTSGLRCYTLTTQGRLEGSCERKDA